MTHWQLVLNMRAFALLILQYALSQAASSSYTCLGECTETRSCLFRNIFFYPASGFLFHAGRRTQLRAALVTTSDTFELAGALEIEQYFSKGPFLSWPAYCVELDRPGCQVHQPAVSFNVHTSSTAPLQVSQSIPDLVLLWHFNNLSVISYGHFLLQDWFPMYLVLRSHGMHKRRVQLFTVNQHSSAGTPVWLHYLLPLFRTMPVSLSNISGWLQFQRVIVGEGGYWAQAHQQVTARFDAHCSPVHERCPATQVQLHTCLPPQAPTLYNSILWQAFRDTMLEVQGIAPLPTACAHRVPVITLNEKDELQARTIRWVFWAEHRGSH
jgi:hypothetical protein